MCRDDFGPAKFAGRFKVNVVRVTNGTPTSRATSVMALPTTRPGGRARGAGMDREMDGAGDGNRTHDIQLGKLSFYH